MTRSWRGVVGCLIAVLCCTGCSTYWRNRSRDAADMFDFGITVSKKPYFAFLPADYFNLTPLGYTRIVGSYHGLWKSKWGTWAIDDDAWGVLAWGSQKLQVGDFSADAPRQFWPEDIAALKAASKPLPTSAPVYNLGFLRVPLHHNPPPFPNGFS
jgi:hypothetical protein